MRITLNFARLMFGYSLFQIIRVPCVIGIVGAAQNIHPETHEADSYVLRHAQDERDLSKQAQLLLQHVQVGHRDAAQHRAHDPQEALVVPADEQVLQVRASRLDFAGHAVHRSVQVAGPLLDGPRREEVREHDAVPEIGDEL